MLRKLTFAVAIGGAVAAGYVGGVFATPGLGFTSVDMSKGRFEEFQVEAGDPEGNDGEVDLVLVTMQLVPADIAPRRVPWTPASAPCEITPAIAGSSGGCVECSARSSRG